MIGMGKSRRMRGVRESGVFGGTMDELWRRSSFGRDGAGRAFPQMPPCIHPLVGPTTKRRAIAALVDPGPFTSPSLTPTALSHAQSSKQCRSPAPSASGPGASYVFGSLPPPLLSPYLGCSHMNPTNPPLVSTSDKTASSVGISSFIFAFLCEL